MKLQIEMEKRTCRKCGKFYKVMASSSQSVCSTECDKYFRPGPGDQSKVTKGAKLGVEKLVVNVTPPTGPLKTKEGFTARVGGWQHLKESRKQDAHTINETRRKLMKEELNGHAKIKSVSLPIIEPATTEVEKNESPKLQWPEIVPTPPVLYEELQKDLARGGLNSMQLLEKSGNRLMGLMENCVSESDVQRAKEGVGTIELHRIAQAIACANAIAQTVQTQVNMVKSMAPLVKNNGY
jgi:hypothetical protein